MPRDSLSSLGASVPPLPPSRPRGPRALAHLRARRPRVSSRRVVKPVANFGKTDIKKVGLNGIEDPTIQQNLMGKSRFMDKKDWKDASGRKGKVRGLPHQRPPCQCLLACVRLGSPRGTGGLHSRCGASWGHRSCPPRTRTLRLKQGQPRACANTRPTPASTGSSQAVARGLWGWRRAFYPVPRVRAWRLARTGVREHLLLSPGHAQPAEDDAPQRPIDQLHCCYAACIRVSESTGTPTSTAPTWTATRPSTPRTSSPPPATPTAWARRASLHGASQ